jgi:hypothetical protein
MAALVIRAIDQKAANASGAHLCEGDFLLADEGGHVPLKRVRGCAGKPLGVEARHYGTTTYARESRPWGLAIIIIKRMILLIRWRGEFFGKMPFGSLKLKPESGANQIKSADYAYSFVAHMRLSYQNKPHWQVARQALNHAGASDANEIQAWRAFRVAVEAEGWLAE